MVRLFVDMDGTLNGFRSIRDPEEMYAKGFFSSAKPYMSVIRAIQWIIENKEDCVDVFILSACPSESLYAETEKNWWLDEYLPEIEQNKRIYTVCGKNKAEQLGFELGEFDLLLDDYSVNLHEWERAGGCGIKLMTGINGNNGTWKGCSVEIGENLLDELLSVIERKREKEDEIQFERSSGICKER